MQNSTSTSRREKTTSWSWEWIAICYVWPCSYDTYCVSKTTSSSILGVGYWRRSDLLDSWAVLFFGIFLLLFSFSHFLLFIHFQFDFVLFFFYGLFLSFLPILRSIWLTLCPDSFPHYCHDRLALDLIGLCLQSWKTSLAITPFSIYFILIFYLKFHCFIHWIP